VVTLVHISSKRGSHLLSSSPCGHSGSPVNVAAIISHHHPTTILAFK